MKLRLKKPEKLTKRHKVVTGGLLLVVVGAVSSLLFISRLTRAAEPPDYKFAKIMPAPDTATQGRDAHLEIAQTGDGNTLDAGASWGKYYFEPSKVSSGYMGISKGGYGGEVDTLGTSRGAVGQRFADTNAVKYEFFLAMDQPDPDRAYFDEVPCSVGNNPSFVPAYTAYSGEMSVTGWYKLAASTFIGKKCGSRTWGATQKSGKFVLFVKASWNTAAPKVNNVTQGRVNAFKLGAAYDGSGDPLTGYWANSDWAYTSDKPTTASYAVQDRLSADNTNGDYSFTFAPDCRLGRGKTEARWLHWSDVDYPDYYKAPWPVQKAPEFDLVEIPPGGGAGTVKLHIGPEDNKFNGPGKQNQHHAVEYKEFKGGFTYKWVWKNIARIDGINFWIPYDDFPAINGGCGTYNQAVEIQGTRGDGWYMKDSIFEVAGGDTVTFLVRGKYVSGTSAAPTSTFGAHLVSQNAATFAGTFTGDGPTSISDQGYKKDGSRVNIEWVQPGMGPTYQSQRDLTFSYQVKGDAQNGAKHCFDADLSPLRSGDPTAKATSGSVCIVVNNSLKPFVKTSGADVHAGDCQYINPKTGLGANLGKIIGPPVNGLNQGSSGSYIVSAADKISDFGSGGLPNGGALTFGKGGYYGSMCRPLITDLDPKKEPEVVEKNGDALAVNGQFDIGTLAAGSRYAVTFNQDVTVVGTAKASMGLYAPKNTITIQAKSGANTFGSDLSNKYAKKQLPTVGVTARDIRIGNGVTNLTAALYASETITTCAENTVAACRSILTLNGYAMAYNFKFNRVGTGSNGLQEAENLKFNPAFYLNPHPGGGILSKVLYRGERAPLY